MAVEAVAAEEATAAAAAAAAEEAAAAAWLEEDSGGGEGGFDDDEGLEIVDELNTQVCRVPRGHAGAHDCHLVTAPAAAPADPAGSRRHAGWRGWAEQALLNDIQQKMAKLEMEL